MDRNSNELVYACEGGSAAQPTAYTAVSGDGTAIIIYDTALSMVHEISLETISRRRICLFFPALCQAGRKFLDHVILHEVCITAVSCTD
jgi:hypothetical protein